MGEIYRAHQLNLKREVAVEVVSKESRAAKTHHYCMHCLLLIFAPSSIKLFQKLTAGIQN